MRRLIKLGTCSTEELLIGRTKLLYLLYSIMYSMLEQLVISGYFSFCFINSVIYMSGELLTTHIGYLFYKFYCQIIIFGIDSLSIILPAQSFMYLDIHSVRSEMGIPTNICLKCLGVASSKL